MISVTWDLVLPFKYSININTKTIINTDTDTDINTNSNTNLLIRSTKLCNTELVNAN